MKLKIRLIATGEYAFIYSAGAVVYSILEVIWRGFTHWTMAVTGGFCLVCLYAANGRMKGKKIWTKCFAGSMIITSVEFIVGCIVNRALDWDVWDYSSRPLNILGQVCPLYSIIWFALCVPAFLLCGFVKDKLFDRLRSGIPKMQPNLNK